MPGFQKQIPECNKEISFGLSGASSTNQLSYNNGLALVLFIQSIYCQIQPLTQVQAVNPNKFIKHWKYIALSMCNPNYGWTRACSSDYFTVHAWVIYIQ